MNKKYKIKEIVNEEYWKNEFNKSLVLIKRRRWRWSTDMDGFIYSSSGEPTFFVSVSSSILNFQFF
jgi:hypothetical protein